jgi:hypothetical protein
MLVGVSDRVAIGRVVLPHWLEMGIAAAIVLVGLLGWELIIVDVWLAETDQQTIGIAHTAVTAKIN